MLKDSNIKELLHPFVIALGVSGCICFNLIICTGLDNCINGLPYSPEARRLTYDAALAVLIVLSCFITSSKRRIMMIRIDVVLAILWGALSVSLQSFPVSSGFFQVLTISYQVLRSFLSLELFLRWNLPMALNPPKELPIIITLSVLFSVGLCITLTLMSPPLFQVFFCLIPCVSFGLLFLIDTNYISESKSVYSLEKARILDTHHSSPVESIRKTRFLFFGSRALWGTAFAALSYYSYFSWDFIFNNVYLSVFLICGLGIALALLIIDWLRKRFSAFILPLLPLLSAAVLFFALADTDLVARSPVYVMIAWLAWRIQSYTQLPTYRRLCNIDPNSFANLARFATAIPYALVGTIFLLSDEGSIRSLLPFNPEDLFGFATAAAVILAGIFITRHIYRYFPDRTTQSTQKSMEGLDTSLTDVSLRYELTPRESEVLAYLVEGYSRPYIEKALYISKSTAKSHTYRIYQKLEVNSQDELLDFVKRQLL